MKKYDTIFILDEFLDTGEFTSDYWYEIDGKSVLEYIIERLASINNVGDITICSDSSDERAKKVSQKYGFSFFPFSDKREKTIVDWGKLQKSDNLFIFFMYSPVFDISSLKSAMEIFDTGKYDEVSLSDYPPSNIIISKKALEKLFDITINNISAEKDAKEYTEKYHSIYYKPTMEDRIFRIFYRHNFLPEHKKLNFYRFIPWYANSWLGKTHNFKALNLPFDPNSYHSSIQKYFLKNIQEIDKIQVNFADYSYMFHPFSSISIESLVGKDISEVEYKSARINRYNKWLRRKSEFSMDIYYNHFDDNALEEILNSNFDILKYIHVDFIDVKKTDKLFSDHNIVGIILKYHDTNEWIQNVANFLENRKNYFRKRKIKKDWNPKIGILFDISELGFDRFDELSKRWDFRRVILEKYHRNLEPQNYWEIFYAQDVAYPEHIILKNNKVQYFQKRFPCKHIERAFINEKAEFYLCPKQKENIIGNLDGNDSFINAMKSPERIKYIKANFNLEFKGLTCENCDLWYNPF